MVMSSENTWVLESWENMQPRRMPGTESIAKLAKPHARRSGNE